MAVSGGWGRNLPLAGRVCQGDVGLHMSASQSMIFFEFSPLLLRGVALEWLVLEKAVVVRAQQFFHVTLIEEEEIEAAAEQVEGLGRELEEERGRVDGGSVLDVVEQSHIVAQILRLVQILRFCGVESRVLVRVDEANDAQDLEELLFGSGKLLLVDLDR